MFFKNIINGHIESVSTGTGMIEITENEYDDLLSLFQTVPTAKDGYHYILRADNLEWELVELPPAPEPQDEELSADEALDIILGVSE